MLNLQGAFDIINQSLVFSRNKSEVWAVQYHPEFDCKWISGLMTQRESLLIQEKIYSNKKEFDNVQNLLSDFEKHKDQKVISQTLINDDIHTLELSNWLKNIKSYN